MAEPSASLNGWKEIAGYLGKSVRAAQRWERDFGLPVRRIKTPKGQVVYAHAGEIDAWRVAMSPRRRELDAEPGADDPAAATGAGVAPSVLHPWRLRAAMLTTAALVVLAAGGAWLAKANAVAPLVETLEVSGTSIHAVSAGRRLLWSYDLGFRPERLKWGSSDGPLRFAKADLDGDGSPELLVPIRSASGGGNSWRESIYCFTRAGRLRWTYTPALTLSYEGRTFSGPWRNYAIAASAGSGRQRAWASFGHHTWWPSFVVELDASGHGTPRYYQSGAIYGISAWETGSNSYLVATGVDNEFGSASVAVMPIDGPAATSPQHAGTGFHCDSCPAAGPAFFAALPRSELNRVLHGSYPIAEGVTVMGNDVKITINDQVQPAPAGSLYFMTDTFRLHDAAFNDQYWTGHRALERSGVISHSAAACPELKGTITEWRPRTGWTTTDLSFAAAPRAEH